MGTDSKGIILRGEERLERKEEEECALYTVAKVLEMVQEHFYEEVAVFCKSSTETETPEI